MPTPAPDTEATDTRLPRAKFTLAGIITVARSTLRKSMSDRIVAVARCSATAMFPRHTVEDTGVDTAGGETTVIPTTDADLVDTTIIAVVPKAA